MKYIFEDSIGMLSALISRKLGLGLEKQFAQNGYSINAIEWTVLSYLANKGPQTQNQLVTATSKNKVYIKRLVDKLEINGFIHRKTLDSDKRFNHIILSKTGEKHFKELLPIVENYMEASFHSISEQERADLLALLKKVLNNI